MRKIIGSLLLVLSFIGIVYMIIERFSNPEFTNTQMIIAYWKYYITILAGLTVGTGLLDNE